MPEISTPADDDAVVTPPAPDAADNKTDDTKVDNLDASKSDDTTVVADDDKKSEDETTTKTDDTSTPKFDDDLGDWITKRGHKVPETDAEKQSFQDLRNEQREFHGERQAKKDADELAQAKADAKKEIPEEEDDELDPIEARQNKIESDLASERATRMQSEFYTSNKVSPEEHTALLTVMKEKFNAPTTPEGKQRALELWSSVDALPDLLDLAKARVAKASSSTVAEEAAQAEREKIERESQAKSPGRNATQTQTSDKTEDQARLERFKARYNKS